MLDFIVSCECLCGRMRCEPRSRLLTHSITIKATPPYIELATICSHNSKITDLSQDGCSGDCLLPCSSMDGWSMSWMMGGARRWLHIHALWNPSSCGLSLWAPCCVISVLSHNLSPFLPFLVSYQTDGFLHVAFHSTLCPHFPSLSLHHSNALWQHWLLCWLLK